MADQRTVAELLPAPTQGYAEAILVPPILAGQFELKHSLINMMTSDQFFRLEKDNPLDHIRWFNKITSTIKYKDLPNSAIKLMLFPFSLSGAARQWIEKEPSRSILTWEDLVSKFINEFFPPSRTINLRNEISNFQQRFYESFHEAWDRYKDLLCACPHYGFTELHQLDTFYHALNSADQDSLNSAAGGNLLERRTQDVLTIIENKSKIAKLTHAVNQQTSAVTTAMTAILKQFQATPPPASVKAVDEICFTCGGAHPYYQCLAAGGNTFLELRDNIQGYVATATLHIKITLVDALILIPKYQKMLKALLFNKERLLELENTPFNENCSAVILKKLPKKLGDLGKFLIPCGFSELKCKALSDLGAIINLMPLFVWKKLGLRELISTRMTLELANRAICTPARIARDVFVSVGKFIFPVDFVIVDNESDPRVPLILGRPFLRTARALIDVHGEEMILYDGDERLTLNMRHDTSRYSNQPQKESINMINIYDDSSEDFLEELFTTNHQSGYLTFSSHPKLTSPKVKDDVFDPEGGNIKPDQGKLTSVVMKDNLAEPRVHVPNVLTTYPTLMLDSDFIPFDNSLPEYEIFYFDIEEKNSGSTTIHANISLPDLECFNFNGKPDPGELTSIVDFGIRENILSATNVNLPPEEDHSPLFAYVVWIFLSFLTYPVVPPNLLSFGNEDTIFDPGISNYHFSSLLPDVSHRCETFIKFNVYLKLLNESPMEILSSTCSPMEQ
nr:reverse transcriptase domain-containing protein [Tanacetum cinerariifolium]